MTATAAPARTRVGAKRLDSNGEGRYTPFVYASVAKRAAEIARTAHVPVNFPCRTRHSLEGTGVDTQSIGVPGAAFLRPGQSIQGGAG